MFFICCFECLKFATIDRLFLFSVECLETWYCVIRVRSNFNNSNKPTSNKTTIQALTLPTIQRFKDRKHFNSQQFKQLKTSNIKNNQYPKFGLEPHSKNWNGTRSGRFQELEWYTVWEAGTVPRIGMVHGLGGGDHSKNWNGTRSGRRGPFQELEWYTVWEAGGIPRIGTEHGLIGGGHSKNWNGTRSGMRGPFHELEWYTVWDAGPF